jgi:hypothetical protein
MAAVLPPSWWNCSYHENVTFSVLSRNLFLAFEKEQHGLPILFVWKVRVLGSHNTYLSSISLILSLLLCDYVLFCLLESNWYIREASYIYDSKSQFPFGNGCELHVSCGGVPWLQKYQPRTFCIFVILISVLEIHIFYMTHQMKPNFIQKL